MGGWPVISADYRPLLAVMRPRTEYTAALLARVTGLALPVVVYQLCKAGNAGRLRRYSKPGITWMVYQLTE